MEYSFWGGLMLMVLMADPLGNIPITISCMKNVPNKRRTFVLFRECMIAMGMLLLAMFFGRPFLAAIGLSDAALSIGGSVTVSYTHLRDRHADGDSYGLSDSRRGLWSNARRRAIHCSHSHTSDCRPFNARYHHDARCERAQQTF